MYRSRFFISLALLLLVFTGCSAENNILSYSGDSILTVQNLLDDPVYDQTISISGRLESMAPDEGKLILAESDSLLHVSFDSRLKTQVASLRIGDNLLLIGSLQRGFLLMDPKFVAKNIRVLEVVRDASENKIAE